MPRLDNSNDGPRLGVDNVDRSPRPESLDDGGGIDMSLPVVAEAPSLPAIEHAKSNVTEARSVGFNTDAVDYISDTSSKISDQNLNKRALSKDYDPQAFINNEVSEALSFTDKNSIDIHRFLGELGIYVHDDGQDRGDVVYGSEEDGAAFGNANSMRRGHSIDQPGAVTDRSEHALLGDLFRCKSTRYVVRSHHLALGRVMSNIFPPDYEAFVCSDSTVMSTTSTYYNPFSTKNLSRIYSSPLGMRFGKFRAWARKVVNQTWFTLTFLTLTMYSLFSTDVSIVIGDKEVEDACFIINGIVFILFLIELLMVLAGIKRYWVTVPFVLDVISLVSILSDTWFMRSTALFGDDEESSRLTRLARTSKMTRLARIARVARITKMIPRLMQFFRKQNNVLARQVLMRRLWRIFLYLDVHSERMISNFDLKCFFITVLQDCPHLLRDSRRELLNADVPFILASTSEMENDMEPHIDFDTFHNIITGTKLGQNMVRWHLEDVENEAGVWSLTQRLSDNTALKVCVGILFLVTVISFLEVEIQDQSVDQSLAQLAHVAQLEHSKVVGPNMTYLCDQISVFVRRLSEPPSMHKALFLYLNGHMHYEEGTGCILENSTDLNAVDAKTRAARVRAASTLHGSMLVLACWPASCIHSTYPMNAALVDKSEEARTTSIYAMVTIVIVILLLLIFIYVLNTKINKFSGNLLQPLRSLVDDMMAMSCLELVHIDEDLPSDKVKPIQVAEELEHLQNAFKSMRLAIRSWSKYVPPCVVERLYISGTEAQIGVRQCQATILFADINGFEETCQGLSPKEVLAMLSTVFGGISDSINKHSGTLLEFIGDEVLAVFNTPKEVRHHAAAGLRTALGIHQMINGRCAVVNDECDREVQVNCRCGVHTGKVFAGNIGSMKRMKYGLLGDAVNLSARLKGLNSRYKTRTLCSDAALMDDGGYAGRVTVVRPVDKVAVKGKSEPTTVYEVMDEKRSGFHSQVAAKHEQAFSLYQQRRFEDARTLFEEVYREMSTAAGSKDESSGMLLARCIMYGANPPPADWDGVDRLNKKTFGDVALPEIPELGQPANRAPPGLSFPGPHFSAKVSAQPAALGEEEMPLDTEAEPRTEEYKNVSVAAECCSRVCAGDMLPSVPKAPGNKSADDAAGCVAC